MTAAVAGFPYCGLPEVVSLLAEAMELFLAGEGQEQLEAALDRRYWALVPDDSVPTARFEAVWRANPSAFASLPDQ